MGNETERLQKKNNRGGEGAPAASGRPPVEEVEPKEILAHEPTAVATDDQAEVLKYAAVLARDGAVKAGRFLKSTMGRKLRGAGRFVTTPEGATVSTLTVISIVAVIEQGCDGDSGSGSASRQPLRKGSEVAAVESSPTAGRIFRVPPTLSTYIDELVDGDLDSLSMRELLQTYVDYRNLLPPLPDNTNRSKYLDTEGPYVHESSDTLKDGRILRVHLPSRTVPDGRGASRVLAQLWHQRSQRGGVVSLTGDGGEHRVCGRPLRLRGFAGESVSLHHPRQTRDNVPRTPRQACRL